MEWIEAVIEIDSETKTEAVELVSAVLIESGINGFQIEDDEEDLRYLEESSSNWDYKEESLYVNPRKYVFIRFYVPADNYGGESVVIIKSGLDAVSDANPAVFNKLELSMTNVDDEGWLDNWKKYYKPFHIGKNLVIRPFWEEYEAKTGELVFTINPGHLFGTGLHQTTKLCLCALEAFVKQGVKVADIGCGSGILSIMSLLLGAEKAYACDLESTAADIAYKNAELNGINRDCYTVETGNILNDASMRQCLMDKSYDIVSANIVADVILELCAYVPDMLKKGGVFICSGIIDSRAEEVKTAISEKFKLIGENSLDGWHCFIAELDR